MQMMLAAECVRMWVILRTTINTSGVDDLYKCGYLGEPSSDVQANMFTISHSLKSIKINKFRPFALSTHAYAFGLFIVTLCHSLFISWHVSTLFTDNIGSGHNLHLNNDWNGSVFVTWNYPWPLLHLMFVSNKEAKSTRIKRSPRPFFSPHSCTRFLSIA